MLGRLFSANIGRMKPETARLDRFDRALLERLQKITKYRRTVWLSRSACRSAVLKRLRRLRRDGVIAADVSIVHPAILESRSRSMCWCRCSGRLRRAGFFQPQAPKPA